MTRFALLDVEDQDEGVAIDLTVIPWCRYCWKRGKTFSEVEQENKVKSRDFTRCRKRKGKLCNREKSKMEMVECQREMEIEESPVEEKNLFGISYSLQRYNADRVPTGVLNK